MSLERKIKNTFTKRGIKQLAKEKIWAIGFGLAYGAINGAYSTNPGELLEGGIFFGAAFPLVRKYMNKYRSGEDVAWDGPTGTAAYFIAYNAAQLIFHQRI